MYITEQCFSMVNIAERVVQVYLSTTSLILPYLKSDLTNFDKYTFPPKEAKQIKWKRDTKKKRRGQKNAGNMIVNHSVASNRVV